MMMAPPEFLAELQQSATACADSIAGMMPSRRGQQGEGRPWPRCR